MIASSSLLRAWIALIVLSLASTALAAFGLGAAWPVVAGMLILAFAWFKARIVLARYMGLATAPAWQRGFDICLGLYAVLLLALYLVPLML